MTVRRAGSIDGVRELRAWLEHIAQSAIDWLDALDASDLDREDDEDEPEGASW